VNIWEILEIEYTTDEKKIRDAYARCAKKVHPEEHPEEFKVLQSAYKQAIKQAKRSVQVNELESQKYVYMDYAVNNTLNEENFYASDRENVTEYKNTDTDKEIYDYSSVYVDEEQYADLEKEFFWRFRHLYQFSYTQNKMQAWRILMENPVYQKLFEKSDFLIELSIEIGNMRHINRVIWEYMIERYKIYDHVTKCAYAIEYIEEKMVINSTRNNKTSLFHLLPEEELIVQEILVMGKKSGKSKRESLQMDFFVPCLFSILHKKEIKVNLNGEYTSGDVPYTHVNKASLFDKIMLVLWIIFIIYAVIMAAKDNGRSKSDPGVTSNYEYESIIESIRDNMNQD